VEHNGRGLIALVGRDSFNSATAVTPWSTPAAAGPARQAQARFNSATAVTPWSTTTYEAMRWTFDRLQFGHGGDAVEHNDTSFTAAIT
jgi:hypothetical protein